MSGGMGSGQLLARMREELLHDLATATENVTLVSPFLSVPIALQLARVARTSTARWTVVTNLNPQAVATGHLSAAGLYALLKAGVQLRSLERLHAKVYVADRNVFLGSGNLTAAGLGASTLAASNVELGVRLDGELGGEAIDLVREWVQASALLTRKEIEAVEERAKHLLTERVLRQRDDKASAERDDLDRGLWVKLQYGEPDWQGWREPSWFSNSKRTTMQPGDLVLIASKTVAASYAIVEVTSHSRDDAPWIVAQGHTEDDAKRWNWVTGTKPWLVPQAGVQIGYEELGFTGQSLRGGYKRLGVAEFARAIAAFEAENTL